MFALVMTWIGIAVATTLLLLMALGPVIVELDGWLAQRRRDRRRTQVQARVARKQATPTVVARPATM
ncbi:hypothetical protein [Actinocrispum sp. NPDC049592]|uniref:hypothetical protein n=1 Tax=Actinocrispum sp. NPDC049592 TaxID=3154835 RepID=UPI0034464211